MENLFKNILNYASDEQKIVSGARKVADVAKDIKASDSILSGIKNVASGALMRRYRDQYMVIPLFAPKDAKRMTKDDIKREFCDERQFKSNLTKITQRM